MPSPFPGMDPYLEEDWGDVHARLVLYACDQIQGLLPKDLRARVEERVFVDSPQTGERDVYPDVQIVQRGRGKASSEPRSVALVTAAKPLILNLTNEPVPEADDEPITETFVDIIDIGSGRSVVTSIEVLSPANKRAGAGRRQYLRKQREVLDGKVSLAEIDLLRSGKSVSVSLKQLPKSHRTPYRAVVRRGWRQPEFELYAVALHERLPTINIPLRKSDADVPLDLQALLDRAYDNGGYLDDIDYNLDPDPALLRGEAAWVDQLLRQKGLRG